MDDGPPPAGAATPVIRRPRFDLDRQAAVAWTPRRPELACAANSVSLLMPYLEPYFVRSVGAALAGLDGPLRARAQAYTGQEGEHHRQHRHYNRALVARHRRLRLVERAAERLYGSLERRAALHLNLAFVAASETIAYSAARWAAERRHLFDGAYPEVSALFWWHLAEEVEHKSVAHDVYQAWTARHGPAARWRRAAVAVLAVALALATVTVLVAAGTTIMLAGQGRLHRPVAWCRLVRWSFPFAFEALANLTVSLLPGYHPDQLTDPSWYDLWHREHAGPG